MKTVALMLSVCLIVLSTAAFGYADPYGHHEGWRHNSWNFGVVIAPPPLPYPVYAEPYPRCERRCHERVVPVCRYDSWGDRWCHDKVVRECERVCY
ncbi:MAG TPA: hypothetical protein VK445_09295 [Dissulfurispiraceae bacterium]|nr:hypothetical protein [Dissulfurispiraceae bacterium]